ncbi:hypothetical protein [Vibrio litoralis]|nr:hypothetical protein [Vibrio litoralis]
MTTEIMDIVMPLSRQLNMNPIQVVEMLIKKGSQVCAQQYQKK